jgi:hypothetical protein
LKQRSRFWISLIAVMWAAVAFSMAQETLPKALPDSPTAHESPKNERPAQVHRFWDRENILLFSGVAASRALDFASTKNFLARGRTEILIPDDIVYNNAGFAALEAAGTMTSVGISYVLHRYGHHTMERWLSIGHIGVTTFGAVRNYSLKTKRPPTGATQ